MSFNSLKEICLDFIQDRAIKRHFQRPAIFETLLKTGVNKEPPPSLAQTLREAAHSDRDTLLKRLGTSTEGLTIAQASHILERVGLNEVGQEKSWLGWMYLWHCYFYPFNLLLSLLAIISYARKDIESTIVLITMVILSTLIRFWQEARADRAADKLKEMVSNTATVIRRPTSPPDDTLSLSQETSLYTADSTTYEVPIKLLVPGDLIFLSAGDMIPADLRVITAKNLLVNQSTMSGESMPVEKFAQLKSRKTKNPFELDNILFMGTNVISGSATAVVITTGTHTYFGAITARVTTADRGPTAFHNGVNKVSWLLIRFIAVMTPLVFILNGLTKGNWVEAFLFALSIAVGLTPGMLPMIVTATLAKGAVTLSREKIIIKSLDAIQNFGAMDVLCTDKTGTLTQEQIFLKRYTNIWGEAYTTVLEYAYLNSYYQTGLKNLLDVAVLEHAKLHPEIKIMPECRKIDEIPFDFVRKRMSVVVAERNAPHLLICKGAVEEVLSICSQVQHNNKEEPLTSDILAKIREDTAALDEEGLRVIAVAAKKLPPIQTSYSMADEKDLRFMGYIAFLEPPKGSTTPALKALKDHGIAVKILTGDNQRITAKVCREVGLPLKGILLGTDIESLTDAQLTEVVEETNIFAKLTPMHKKRIVQALRNNGHIVGFLGDGINDAPALRTADIGISVNSGVDIAKEAADIILLKKSLMVLQEGIIEGRKTFVNMLKYIKMTASANFGNVFSVLIASVFLPFLPMLPMQLLLQNLLYDISQLGTPFDYVEEELLTKPQRWKAEDIGRFMLFFGPLSSIFDIITFCLMWFVFGATTPSEQTLFQSGWFLVGLLTQILPCLQTRASPLLMMMISLTMVIGIFLPMGPFGHYFKLQALPHIYFLFLFFILLGYILLFRIVKKFYEQRYGRQ